MHRRVRRRPDGVLEIRPTSWRERLAPLHPGLVAVLVVACVVCSSLGIAGLLHLVLQVKGGLLSTLLVGAVALVVAPRVRAAGVARCAAKRLSAPR